ncbi:MAG: amidohydrolase [Chloroflexi bacterium]|nr:amidohydrolase [Chloroflexota bacterium]
MIIDFHTHAFPLWIKNNREDYLRQDTGFARLYSHPRARIATAEEIVAAMDRDGVDVSVVLSFGWRSHQLCREGNDYLLEAAQRYPKRLVAFCSLQPAVGEAALVELERCAGGGARGIGELRPEDQGFDLMDETVMPALVQKALEYRLPLLLHTSEPVGHHYPGKGVATPEVLYPFIHRYPGLSLICAHWGGGLPFYALMPEVARALGNVYFDTAASPFLYRRTIYSIVTQIMGDDRILFGSDFPLLSQRRCLESIASLPQASKARILGQNAHRLLWGDGE